MSSLKELFEKKICTSCIDEPVLKSQVRTTGMKACCSYCGKTRQHISAVDLAEVIDAAFKEHYVRVDDDDDGFGLLSQFGFSSDEGIPVVDAISDAAGISVPIALEIQSILQARHQSRSAYEMRERTDYDAESQYQRMRPSDAGMREDWDAFELELKHRARFFNRRGADLLASVFGHIDRLPVRKKQKLVVTAGPGCRVERLFRARVFQSESSLLEALKNPEQQLGSPPPKIAATGRMNARGISVFYGADSCEGAIAEVRPPVGSKVAVGAFDIIHHVTLLDLTALPFVQHGRDSIFDPGTKKRMERIVFLQSLGERMTKPVMPDDQDIEYLVTQAIADFLSNENTPRLDGIIFESVQTPNSRNVVLFNHSSAAENPVRPEGTEVVSFRFSHHGDGPESSILVFENVPTHPPEPRAGWHNWTTKTPVDPTLRLDRETITVHNIKGVTYFADTTAVLIQRRIKDEDEF
ncbi:RES family NAD+ phosphorylase [Massilia sp. CFBP9012]|uniref:RES family NAD+ phosphorylase n=1 Tax=Massilia sp. CFBP9012 TaxID=3096531 RepID=UPI002A6A4F87|nr:RES family NAD+ phosphorylase [Massilia sp. CFBP9012]MDY0977724.1 RES family NAD+ phosphorylase [Massilia sp. CFBP9012]